jgi:hypothetical protein
MKRFNQPAKPAASKPHSDSDPMSALNRLTLGFLDDYTREKQGYDPYDTSRGRKPDIWRTKRKRA